MQISERLICSNDLGDCLLKSVGALFAQITWVVVCTNQ